MSKFYEYESESAAREELGEVSEALFHFLAYDWQLFARNDQLPPVNDAGLQNWRTWLMLGGRAAGKTRAGAEWVRALVRTAGEQNTAHTLRIALVGETMRDARAVMIDGVSGLLAVHFDAERPHFETLRQQLVWPNGAIAQVFSAEDPDGLRGPQFHAAWCDELTKWRLGEETWDMLQLALRLGDNPRQLVTTTPRPIPLLRRLLADTTTVVSRMRTEDNAENLAPTFIAEMRRRYDGTALGRQELDGEVIEDDAGALWRRDWIETMRSVRPLTEILPELQRIVVALDPPVTSTASSDACGIVVAGRGPDGRAYVLADRTLQGREASAWARAAIAAYRDFDANCLVAEVNQGGDLVAGVLKQIDAGVPITNVRATCGKYLRAEPVAALYAEGRVSHVGTFAPLEDQMLTFGVGGLKGGKSPDRLDALVWALTALMLEAPAVPSVRQL